VKSGKIGGGVEVFNPVSIGSVSGWVFDFGGSDKPMGVWEHIHHIPGKGLK